MALFKFAILLLHLYLHVCGSSKTVMKGRAYVFGSVELKCNFSKPERLDKSKMAYHWQKENPETQKEDVLYEFKLGKTIMDHLDPKYSNRNMTLLPNWNLLIHDITLRDKGIYKCLVFNQTTWLSKIHESIFTLDVIVNVTYPEINVVSNYTEKFGSTLELECHSKMSYPDPEGVMWNICNSSGIFFVEGNSTVLTDTRTQIFNVSSKMYLFVAENTNVSCMIKADHELKSGIFEIRAIGPSLPPDNWDYSLCIYIAIGVVLFSLLAVVIGCFVLKSRPAQLPSPESNQRNGTVAVVPLLDTVRIDSNRTDEEADPLNDIGNSQVHR